MKVKLGQFIIDIEARNKWQKRNNSTATANAIIWIFGRLKELEMLYRKSGLIAVADFYAKMKREMKDSVPEIFANNEQQDL